MTEIKQKVKKGFGVGEWCDSSVNCFFGCSNFCSYCYALRMALRFGRIKNPEEWNCMSAEKRCERVNDSNEGVGSGNQDKLCHTLSWEGAGQCSWWAAHEAER